MTNTQHELKTYWRCIEWTSYLHAIPFQLTHDIPVSLHYLLVLFCNFIEHARDLFAFHTLTFTLNHLDAFNPKRLPNEESKRSN